MFNFTGDTLSSTSGSIVNCITCEGFSIKGIILFAMFHFDPSVFPCKTPSASATKRRSFFSLFIYNWSLKFKANPYITCIKGLTVNVNASLFKLVCRQYNHYIRWKGSIVDGENLIESFYKLRFINKYFKGKNTKGWKQKVCRYYSLFRLNTSLVKFKFKTFWGCFFFSFLL